MLNSREVTSLTWLSIGLVWDLSREDVRNSLGAVLRALLHPKIVLPIVAFAGYVSAIVFVAERVGLWNAALFKDTVIWFVATGLVLLFNVSGAASDERFFARTALATLGLAAFLEFYMNLVVFPLLVELVLQPVVVFLALLSVVAARDPTSRSVKSVVDVLLALIGMVMFVIVAVQLIGEWASLDKAGTLLSFTLPVWLTVCVLPFIYLFSLLVNYELAFMRVGFAAHDNQSRRRAKLALVTGFHLRNHALHAFSGEWFQQLVEVKTFSAARQVIAEHAAWLREQKAAKEGERTDCEGTRG